MFKLALQLGKSVKELSNEIDNDELIEWMAYDRIDPFGGYRTDIQTAQLQQLFDAYIGSKPKPLNNYLLIDPNPLPPEIAEQRAYEAEVARLTAETAEMQELLFADM